MKKSYLALIFCAVLIPLSAYSACVTPPDCEEIGFTMDASKCEGSFLRCPWDLNKAACKEKEVIETGAILYGDGTVSKEYPLSGKTPIGVVFDETNKLAVALTDVKKDDSEGSEKMSWSILLYDIPELKNCGEGASACDLSDGRANTDKILACGSDCGGTPAATACNLYQPTGCTKDFCTKGKWFLPSMRDLNNIYQIKALINSTLIFLSFLGGENLSDDNYYWSSTESNDLFAKTLYFFNAFRNGHFKYAKTDLYVRPVIYYGDTTTTGGSGSSGSSGGNSGLTLPNEWADCARICETHRGMGAVTGDTFMDESSCDCSLFGY